MLFPFFFFYSIRCVCVKFSFVLCVFGFFLLLFYVSSFLIDSIRWNWEFSLISIGFFHRNVIHWYIYILYLRIKRISEVYHRVYHYSHLTCLKMYRYGLYHKVCIIPNVFWSQRTRKRIDILRIVLTISRIWSYWFVEFAIWLVAGP